MDIGTQKMKTLLYLAAVLTLGLFAGCQSGKEPGSTSHALVQINNHMLAEIQQTTAKVFGEDGYTQTYSTPELMVFERPGSRRDALKYGGWTGEGVTMQVRVAFTALAGGSYRLQADAYSVQNAS